MTDVNQTQKVVQNQKNQKLKQDSTTVVPVTAVEKTAAAAVQSVKSKTEKSEKDSTLLHDASTATPTVTPVSSPSHVKNSSKKSTVTTTPASKQSANQPPIPVTVHHHMADEDSDSMHYQTDCDGQSTVQLQISNQNLNDDGDHHEHHFESDNSHDNPHDNSHSDSENSDSDSPPLELDDWDSEALDHSNLLKKTKSGKSRTRSEVEFEVVQGKRRRRGVTGREGRGTNGIINDIDCNNASSRFTNVNIDTPVRKKTRNAGNRGADNHNDTVDMSMNERGSKQITRGRNGTIQPGKLNSNQSKNRNGTRNNPSNRNADPRGHTVGSFSSSDSQESSDTNLNLNDPYSVEKNYRSKAKLQRLITLSPFQIGLLVLFSVVIVLLILLSLPIMPIEGAQGSNGSSTDSGPGGLAARRPILCLGCVGGNNNNSGDNEAPNTVTTPQEDPFKDTLILEYAGKGQLKELQALMEVDPDKFRLRVSLKSGRVSSLRGCWRWMRISFDCG